MRNLLELTEVAKSDLPSIYCDMDEVLVAFMKGADAAVGGDGFARMKDKNKRCQAGCMDQISSNRNRCCLGNNG